MTKNLSKSTNKAKDISARKAQSRNFRTESQNRQLFLIPSVILTLFGVFMFISSLFGEFSFTFIEPLVALLLTTLGVLFAWKITKRASISKYAQGIAWVFTFIVVMGIIFWFGGANDNTCTGIMGAQISCMEKNRFFVTVLLLNPFSLILWTILAISGIIGLLTKPKRS